MNFAGKYAFVGDEEEAEQDLPAPPLGFGALPPPPAMAQQYMPLRRPKPNVNILSVDLSSLGDAAVIATGDPVFCNCGAAFSSISKIDPNQSSWKCEFCGVETNVMLDEEEIPKADTVDYVLEPATVANQAKEGLIVFCIDISGSMCVTTEVPGLFALKGDDQRQASLAAFGDQWFPGQRRDVTYVSRLQCVQAAINNQVEMLHRNEPNTKVALVCFNSEVLVIGDGTQHPKTVAGDALHDYDKLVDIGRDFRVEKSVGERKDALLQRLFELEEGGATALGPAVAVALGMAERVPGATIVIATDGISNTGIGAMDKRNEAELAAVGELFTKIGIHAKEKSTTINVVSIRGEEVNMSLLGQMAAATDGNVSIVDPTRLREEFAEMLQAKLVATNVSAKLLVHQGLRLINVDDMGEAGAGTGLSSTTKKFGSAYEDTEATFEYEVKSKEELERLLGVVEPGKSRSLPFQVQITYSRLDGMKCVRIITRTREVTVDRKQAERELDAGIVGQHVWAKSAALAQRGDYNAAIANNVAAEAMLSRAAAPSDHYTSFQQLTTQMTAQLSKARDKYQAFPQSAPKSNYGALPPPAPGASSSSASAIPSFGAPPQYGAVPQEAAPDDFSSFTFQAQPAMNSEAPQYAGLPQAQQQQHVDDETFEGLYQYSRTRNVMKKKK